MANTPQRQPGEMDSLVAARLDTIREEFEAAWQATLRGAEPPSREAFLADTVDPERSALDAALQRIQQRYQQQSAQEQVATEELDATPQPASDGPSATMSCVGPVVAEPTPTMDGSSATSDELDFSLAATPDTETGSNRHIVAGYEILGELGRGGMGVVYKARQRGLNRLVALKMILGGAHVGATQLARFQVEAEAVARLQHPNIVQIHEVGEHDGMPYFSLEFVNGSPLDKKIGGKPQPAREAAQLTETLARAIYFAHQQGIIHRDLKPANVLMTRDGIPKITDFGLAKRLEEESSVQTQSGTILGTPSYMAPEQARGDVRLVGPPSDGYALGAMLYALLTGRPPFQGSTPMDTVLKVTRDEAVPPTRLRPDIPADLETICLKCLQKEPEKRYSNCFELAEDLHRYLTGEPIKARPVGPAERLWRWCRRNPWLAALEAAVIVLAVVSTIAAFVVYGQKQEVVRQEAIAKEQEGIAKANAIAEARARAEAERKEAEAQSARKLAQEQRKLALDALKSMVNDVQAELKGQAAMQGLRQKLLTTASANLQKVADSMEKNAHLREISMAVAYMEMGGLLKELGKSREAFHQYELMDQILVGLAEANQDSPDRDKYQLNVAVGHTLKGDMSLVLLNESAPALQYYREALRVRLQLWENPNANVSRAALRNDLAATYSKIGAVEEPAEARKNYLKALELFEEWAAAEPANADAKANIAYTLVFLGSESFKLGETPTALHYEDKATRLWTELLQKQPQDAKTQKGKAYAHEKLGEIHLQSRDAGRAREQLDLALQLDRALAAADPQNVEHKDAVARLCYDIGLTALRQNDRPTADKFFAEALGIRDKRLQADPDNVPLQKDLMMSLARAGDHARAAEMAQTIQSRSAKDAGSLYRVACCYAVCFWAIEHGKSPLSPADQKLQQSFAARAVEALRQAVALDFKDFRTIEADPDLDPIRNYPEYRSLAKEFPAKRTASADRR
jgi:serine/threonine-protein kinase